MIKIEKYVTMSPEQWGMVIEGMRNPLNSWDNSDSYYTYVESEETLNTAPFEFFLGEEDHKLMTKLNNRGTSHSKYRRMMPVWVTITAPLYWWKEFDTYKVGTVSNSCSTMHKIGEKEFTLDDFSHEHLFDDMRCAHKYNSNVVNLYNYFGVADELVNVLNNAREHYLETDDKKYWWQMIQLLPTSYNQKRTIFLTYEVLAAMYRDRKDHKQDEWRAFCAWIETLPYAELITGTKDGPIETLKRKLAELQEKYSNLKDKFNKLKGVFDDDLR